MHTPVTLPNVVSRRMRTLLEIGWAIIIAKCLAVPWVISHWQIPVHPGWVIVPTVLFAALITVVVLAWRED